MANGLLNLKRLIYLLITYIGKFQRTHWLRTRQLNPIEKKATKMADRSRKSNKVLKQSLKESAENKTTQQSTKTGLKSDIFQITQEIMSFPIKTMQR